MGRCGFIQSSLRGDAVDNCVRRLVRLRAFTCDPRFSDVLNYQQAVSPPLDAFQIALLQFRSYASTVRMRDASMSQRSLRKHLHLRTQDTLHRTCADASVPITCSELVSHLQAHGIDFGARADLTHAVPRLQRHAGYRQLLCAAGCTQPDLGDFVCLMEM